MGNPNPNTPLAINQGHTQIRDQQIRYQKGCRGCGGRQAQRGPDRPILAQTGRFPRGRGGWWRAS
eukprot:scaffold6383_cov112-Isochrysis_galbana.AAC.2